MHSYHGEWVSVAEPQEDAFQTLTAASRSRQNQMHHGRKQAEHSVAWKWTEHLFNTDNLRPCWVKTKFVFIKAAAAAQWYPMKPNLSEF